MNPPVYSPDAHPGASGLFTFYWAKQKAPGVMAEMTVDSGRALCYDKRPFRPTDGKEDALPNPGMARHRPDGVPA